MLNKKIRKTSQNVSIFINIFIFFFLLFSGLLRPNLNSPIQKSIPPFSNSYNLENNYITTKRRRKYRSEIMNGERRGEGVRVEQGEGGGIFLGLERKFGEILVKTRQRRVSFEE